MENLNTFDFRTEFQKRRDERRKKVVALFKDYRMKAMPGVSNTAVMRVVADDMRCSMQNVRVMLINEGIIKPRRIKTINH